MRGRGSPSEFGLGADKSEYGIILSSLRLRAEPQIDYHWGDSLSLMANNQPFNDATLTGFTVRTPLGVHTLGPVATMHLCTPPAERNMVLEVDAKPFLVDTRLLEQRVSVLANGQPVGEWTWRAELPDHHVTLDPTGRDSRRRTGLGVPRRTAGFTSGIRPERR